MQMWAANREGNSNPFPYKVGSYAKSALRFQPRSIVQALQTVSRVEMNAQTKGALDTVCNAIRSCRLFKLDTAVVVIHRMTTHFRYSQDEYKPKEDSNRETLVPSNRVMLRRAFRRSTLRLTLGLRQTTDRTSVNR